MKSTDEEIKPKIDRSLTRKSKQNRKLLEQLTVKRKIWQMLDDYSILFYKNRWLMEIRPTIDETLLHRKSMFYFEN